MTMCEGLPQRRGQHLAVEALSARIRSAWTAFARTGDPGRPAYDTDRRLVRLLDTAPTVAAYPQDASRRSWERHTFAELPLTTT
ncbi:hypothetical protein ACIBAG_31140 [Streptomyces sp. NPDC051243]|uniref:hypothetical protein n=1 Tax=Streptomyces sp. NPDC051243 TaxID=3365646 RepID=UPI0037986987